MDYQKYAFELLCNVRISDFCSEFGMTKPGSSVGSSGPFLQLRNHGQWNLRLRLSFFYSRPMQSLGNGRSQLSGYEQYFLRHMVRNHDLHQRHIPYRVRLIICDDYYMLTYFPVSISRWGFGFEAVRSDQSFIVIMEYILYVIAWSADIHTKAE